MAAPHRIALRALAGIMVLLACALVRADKVHLQSGRVLEGKVSREGDKVAVTLESGTVRIDAKSVLRIESAETPLDRITRLRAALPKAAVEERLTLANLCRAAELARCERELLEEVIARDPEHAEARRRLGHVRDGQGWLTRAELARRNERADRDARAESERALAQAQVERETAELTRKQAELALARERLALQRAELERTEPPLPPYGTYFGGYVLRPPRLGRPHPKPHKAPEPEPYIINGVRAPDEGGFNLPGVRSPASYFR